MTDKPLEGPRYRFCKKAVIDGRLYRAGEEIESMRVPGTVWEPINNAAWAKVLSYRAKRMQAGLPALKYAYAWPDRKKGPEGGLAPKAPAKKAKGRRKRSAPKSGIPRAEQAKAKAATDAAQAPDEAKETE